MAERVYSVETPDNLVLYFERAGFVSRALAQGIDLLVMAMLAQGAIWLLSPLELVAGSAASALWIIVGFLVQWGYGALSEWRFGGRTLGKHLNGLAVVDASGLQLSFSQSAVRNLLRIVDLLPGFYLLGALCSLLDVHGRRLGDLAARTVVVRSGRALPPKNLAHSTRAQIGTWAAPILLHLRSDEREALISLCAALETLALSDRLSLCNDLVEHFARRHQLLLPQHLSAERVLLLVREALSCSSAPARPSKRAGPRASETSAGAGPRASETSAGAGPRASETSAGAGHAPGVKASQES